MILVSPPCRHAAPGSVSIVFHVMPVRLSGLIAGWCVKLYIFPFSLFIIEVHPPW